MSNYLLESDQKDVPPIEFRLFRNQQYFPEKKPQKETMSIEGIMKLFWITKYNDILPSVLIVTFSFSADWPISEWVRRESAILEYFSKIKNSLYSRDIKIVLVPFRTGAGFQDVYEDRINSVKKRFQIDSRNLIVLTAGDMIAPGSSTVRRLSKTIREFSTSFYASHAKRVRNIEKSLRATDFILIARYNFKVSFLSEFQGQSARALRHYRTAYAALTTIYNDASNHIGSQSSIFEQAKVFGEWINYKICLLYLRTSLLKEASSQLRAHITAFSKPLQSSPLWFHYSWVADQYIIFAQLLDVCGISSSFIDADR